MEHYSGVVISRGLVKEPKPLGFPHKFAEAAGKVVLPEDQRQLEEPERTYTPKEKEPIQTYVTTKKEAPVQERKSTTLDEAIQPREEPPEQMFE